MAAAKKKTKVEVDPLEDLFGDVDFEAADDFGQWGAWPTSMPLIDLLSGIGGLPKGDIVELFGQESSGKSTAALTAIAAAQKEGKLSLYFDYEGSFKKEWAVTLGVDVDDKSTFRLLTPKTMEEGFKLMEKVVEHPTVGKRLALMVIDSVSEMVTQAELNQGYDGMQPGLRARKLNQCQVLLKARMRELQSRAALVYINQLYEIIGFGGVPGQTRKTTPGGRATKFGTSLRIEFKIIGQLDGKAMNYKTGKLEKIKGGQKVRATAIKNKASSNAKMSVEYAIIYGIGFDNVYTMTDIALSRKLIKAAGAKYTIPGEFTADGEEVSMTGKDAMREHFYTNHDLYLKLETAIMNLITMKVDTNTGEVLEDDSADELDLLMGDLDAEDLV